MTSTEKLEMLTTLLQVDSKEEDRLSVYLDMATREILSWRYSYAEEIPTEVPAEYEMTQIQAVIAGYNISGAEGQKTHNENGINRTFVYEDMIAYIRGHVIPIVRLV